MRSHSIFVVVKRSFIFAMFVQFSGTALGQAAGVSPLTVSGDSQSANMGSESDESSAAEPPRIIVPSLGRPIFVAPGDEFDVALDREFPAAGLKAHLVRGNSRQALRVMAVNGRTARFQVSTEAAPRVHDLEITANGTTIRAPHCVALWRASERIRIVQICNPPSPGDPTARAFINAANLLAPTLVVFAGGADGPACSALAPLFQEFDAPVLVAAGPRDDLADFGSVIAASPVGSVEIGDYRALALCDHPRAPLESDLAQVRWIEQTLAAGAGRGMCLAISSDPHPNLLRYWRQHGVLDRAIHRGRLGLWLTAAGSPDAGNDREVVNAARPLLFSPAPIELGTLPSLRVIDIERSRVRLPLTADRPNEPLPISPSQLTVAVERVGADAVIDVSSGLRGELGGLAVWVEMPKNGSPRPPTCRGARLEESIDAGTHWECRLGFDLPAQGHVQASLIAGS